MTMTAQRSGFQVLEGLREALWSLWGTDTQSVWQAADGDVREGLAVVGQVRQLLEVAEVALVREGVTRGLPTESSWSVHDWVSRAEGERAPRPASGHVGSVVRVATAGARLGGGPGRLVADDAAERPGVGAVAGTFAEGDLRLGAADQLVRFHESMRRVADPDLLEADLGVLLGQAKDDVIYSGTAGRMEERVHGLGERELRAALTMTARMLKPDPLQDAEDERRKASRSLTKSAGPCGMTRYTAVLDPEGAAVLDAALAALSAPVKGPDGSRDERSAPRRRADALVEIVRRGVSSPGEATKTDKAQVLVTICLETLLGELGRTHGGGVTATGEVLPPSMVRKMACDGGIIPVVLGTDGEVLDLGRTARLFTPAQKKALWLRDGGCTFPACTMPAQWTDAHHLDWWSRGGHTDLARAALLCERHHTKVHRLDLTATVTASGVTWHL